MFTPLVPRAPHLRSPLTHRKFVAAAAAGVAFSVVVVGCGSGSTKGAGSAGSGSVTKDLGNKPITLTVETQDDAPNVAEAQQLSDAFHAKYPNVTVKIAKQAFVALQQNGPRIISTSDAPDVMQFPTLGNAVKDQLLTDLDPYATLYGWDKFPATQLDQWRVSANGTLRGSGKLYGMGLSFSIVGVYYNKSEAQALGMTAPPTTLTSFQDLLAKAKAAGKQPMLTNAKDGGSFLPFEDLMLAMGKRQDVTDWTFDKPGATIVSPEAVDAATIFQDWAKKGYLTNDSNALGNDDVVDRFSGGTGVFWIDGNWNAATLNQKMGSNVGFFLLPPDNGKPYAAMSDPENFVIPAKSQHKDAAAAFLNFAYSAAGRQVVVSTVGQLPGGPADAPIPNTPPGSVVAATLDAFQKLNQNNGITPYIGNATSAIFTDTLIPQLEILLAGKASPKDFVDKLQSDYKSQLSG